MDAIPTITKRRLQAEVIRPIYKEMVKEKGEEQARSLLTAAIRKAAISEAKDFARREIDGITSLGSFVRLFELWTAEDALEIEVLEQSDTVFSFDVTRCKYAEMYHEMGLGHIGSLLSYNRDGAFCEGYDARIKLDRKQTIMGGSDRCTFRYQYGDSDS